MLRTTRLQPRLATPAPPSRRRVPSPARAGGSGGAFGAWKDLAEFVAGSGAGNKGAFESLADRIGRDVYIDVAGW